MDGQQVFVSLGSNSHDATQMLSRARDGIAALPGVEVCSASRVYATEPQDYADQPWFQNQVLRLHAGGDWIALRLLEAFLRLEAALGRVRDGERFGPRCIDVDLLLFGGEVSVDVRCILPHPRMTRRAFVLLPLAELAPDIVIRGRTPAQWLETLCWRLDKNKIFQSG